MDLLDTSSTTPAERYGNIETVDLRDGDIKLPAVVYRPAISTPAPGIVLGPGGLGQGNIQEMGWLARALLARGHVVVIISYRAAYPGDDDRDFGLGLDLLETLPEVDRRRIALVGDSRGGMSALRAAALDPRVRAVVGLAPPCDMAHNVRNTVLYAPMRHRAQITMMGAEPDERPELYERVQAISYADRIKVPVLLVHGLFDMHAPPEMSIWMERALRRAGNNRVRVELLEGLGHFWERQHIGNERHRVADIVCDWVVDTLAEDLLAAQRETT